MLNLRNKLRPLLKQRNTSWTELAAKIGMSKGTLFTVLKKNDLSVSQLELLAKEFNVPISYFFETSNFWYNQDELESTLFDEKIQDSSEKTVEKTIFDLQKQVQFYRSKTQALQHVLQVTNELIKSKDDIIKLLKKEPDSP